MIGNDTTLIKRKGIQENTRDTGSKGNGTRTPAGGEGAGAITRFATTHPSSQEARVTSKLVLRELRSHNFAVLSTVGEDGTPDSAGVNYGVTGPGRDLALYVMTRRHLKKARNIARNPLVSLVVPLPRRILQFVPPATMQLRGRAEILDWTDSEGTAVFRHFWMGRRILAGYEESRRRGETRVCFIRITLDPLVRTYAVGYSAWELRRHMESAAATVRIPASRQV
jgi:nitroimidazol reductase NimA-like FMN-containing flavoprotein (pyridoxamine 5'-phosphate oxidase superfamily)